MPVGVVVPALHWTTVASSGGLNAMLAGNLCRLAKVLSCRATMPLQRRVSLAARSDMVLVRCQQEQETRQDVGMNLSSGRLFPEREEWRRGWRATVRPVSPEWTLQWRVALISEKNWINLNHMVVKVEASIPYRTLHMGFCIAIHLPKLM